MPVVTNQSVRIHYEVVGDGPPLVLHHGLFSNLWDWDEFGYVDALKPSRRLILIDARGHGDSDKPHDPAAYDLALRVGDVTAVLDELDVDRTDYFGFSMGGWIGLGLAKYAPERLGALILLGAHPYAESMQPFRSLIPTEPGALDAMLRMVFGRYMTPTLEARLAKNEPQALLALTQDRASMAEVLPTLTQPCLLLCGDADPRLTQMQACAEALEDAAFVTLPNCDHLASFARSDLVLPVVTGFLAEIEDESDG